MVTLICARNERGLGPLLKGDEICPWVLREAFSAIDAFLIYDPTDGVDYSTVPKPDRGSGTEGDDFVILPRVVIRAGGCRRPCFDLDLSLK